MTFNVIHSSYSKQRGEDYIIRSLSSVLLTKYNSGDQIKKTEMGRRCSTYGGRGEVHTGLWWGNLREGDHLEDSGVDGKIVLN